MRKIKLPLPAWSNPSPAPARVRVLRARVRPACTGVLLQSQISSLSHALQVLFLDLSQSLRVWEERLLELTSAAFIRIPDLLLLCPTLTSLSLCFQPSPVALCLSKNPWLLPSSLFLISEPETPKSVSRDHVSWSLSPLCPNRHFTWKTYCDFKINAL